MSKLDRIIRLINLLNSRQSVSLKTIKTVCDVPERTAYRYLNSISGADIPVYYDRELRGYTLSSQFSRQISNLKLEEVILMVLALKALAAGVNSEYRLSVSRLISKILALISAPIEEAVRSAESRPMGNHQDHSEMLTACMIHAALECERGIVITIDNPVGDNRQVEIRRPCLLFRNGWRVTGTGCGDKDGFPLAAITKVSIM